MYLNCKGVLQVGDYNWKSQGFYNIQLLKHTLGLNLENCLEDKWCYILKWRIFFFFFCPLWKSHLVVGFLGKGKSTDSRNCEVFIKGRFSLSHKGKRKRQFKFFLSFLQNLRSRLRYYYIIGSHEGTKTGWVVCLPVCFNKVMISLIRHSFFYGYLVS